MRGFFYVLIFINMNKIFSFIVGGFALILAAHYAIFELIFTGDIS